MIVSWINVYFYWYINGKIEKIKHFQSAKYSVKYNPKV